MSNVFTDDMNDFENISAVRPGFLLGREICRMHTKKINSVMTSISRFACEFLASEVFRTLGRCHIQREGLSWSRLSRYGPKAQTLEGFEGTFHGDANLCCWPMQNQYLVNIQCAHCRQQNTQLVRKASTGWKGTRSLFLKCDPYAPQQSSMRTNHSKETFSPRASGSVAKI